MPLITVRTVMTASGTATPLASTQFEFAPYNATIHVAIQADATGVLGTIQSGSDVLQEEGPVQIGTINVQPKYPDDFFLEDVVAAGERIKVALRDTSAAVRTVMTSVMITPI